jgi:lipopolysaccharide export system ATP-binding protein
MALFQIEQISKRFGGRQVVTGVTMTVEPGEVVGLLGANGAGKSTVFRMAVGLLKPDSGKISFVDQDVTQAAMHRRAHLGMGYLAQEPTVFTSLSVADNVRIVLEQYHPRSEIAGRLDGLLGELNLRHLAESRAASLSGGERRRLEITRALVVEPKLLFFDEPFAGVDPRSRGDITTITQQLKQRGISVLITDHHAESILRMVDRLYVMEAGSILASGTPDEIMANEAVRRAYLGEAFHL